MMLSNVSDSFLRISVHPIQTSFSNFRRSFFGPFSSRNRASIPIFFVRFSAREIFWSDRIPISETSAPKSSSRSVLKCWIRSNVLSLVSPRSDPPKKRIYRLIPHHHQIQNRLKPEMKKPVIFNRQIMRYFPTPLDNNFYNFSCD